MKPYLKLNVGISNKYQDIKEEASKIEYAIENNVEYISQISIEKTKLYDMWDLVSSYKNVNTTFCSVPIYESVLLNEPILETIQRQYESGVRCFTLDCTPRFLMEKANNDKNFRINSRGGYFLVEYFKKNPDKQENPIIEKYDEIIKFFETHNCEYTIAIVLRPGNGADYSMKYLLEEIEFYNKENFLKDKTIEVGGHIRFNNFQKLINVLNGVKVSIMGPLITDATNKYDHITNIMGQNLFASLYKNVAGLLIISPAEHLHLPNFEETKEAIIYAKIAQHEVGLMYQDESCLSIEDEFNKKTISCNIKRNLFGEIKGLKPCDMCGNYCPLRNIKK